MWQLTPYHFKYIAVKNKQPDNKDHVYIFWLVYFFVKTQIPFIWTLYFSKMNTLFYEVSGPIFMKLTLKSFSNIRGL